MTRGDNDNLAPERSDRSAALDLVCRTIKAGDTPLQVDGSLGQVFATRWAYVFRALEIDGLAVIRRADDGRPLGANLTELGTFVGECLAAGDVVLLPGHGGIKVAGTPTQLRQRGRHNGPGPAIPVETPALILASAPLHYGADTVEGSATPVIVDRLASWADHPATRLRRRPVKPVSRAWEIFSNEGLSFGLVLETADGFEGLDSHGGPSLEFSLSEAAWQVRVNC